VPEELEELEDELDEEQQESEVPSLEPESELSPLFSSALCSE
jgi:hypothetical protein